MQIQEPVVDQIAEASENNLPSLPTEKYDIPLSIIQAGLLWRVRVE